MELAEAIVRHPLSARVMVNRIWMHHFGRGIVATPSNFGVTGERPTHPELLDYLAARLIENHWSIKALHREIMLSATYQLGAQHSEPNDSADPENKLLWRANLRRLEVEALRDSLLFVSGTLDETAWRAATGAGRARRTRSAPSTRESGARRICAARARAGSTRHCNCLIFRIPHISGDQRSNTNVPLQGLFFLNSDLVMSQAELLARRLTTPGREDDTDRHPKGVPLALRQTGEGYRSTIGTRFSERSSAEPAGGRLRLAAVCPGLIELQLVLLRGVTDGAPPILPRSRREALRALGAGFGMTAFASMIGTSALAAPATRPTHGR